ncbi:MAG: polysaccharide deacetylase family protein, partial [Kiritimatiellae bacterium]|nr:polysaccharide deacetylase family protein [Kiritimatiellia bacterium]
MRYSGATALERWRSRDALRIVTYHGVDERDDPVMNFDRLQVHPERFQRQIEQLAREYRIVELSSAVRHWLEHGTWPTRSLAITFDDGYLNNLKVAAPILNRVGVHATFFVTSSFIEGRSQPWWYAARAVIAGQGGEKAGAQRNAARLEAEWRPLPEEERSERLLKLSGDDRLPEPYYPFMRKEDVAELAGQGFDVQPHGDAHISFR